MITLKGSTLEAYSAPDVIIERFVRRLPTERIAHLATVPIERFVARVTIRPDGVGCLLGHTAIGRFATGLEKVGLVEVTQDDLSAACAFDHWFEAEPRDCYAW